MANLEKKSFDQPDELKTPEKTKAAVVNFGNVAASRVILQPGWKWSECIKPEVGTESCQAGHVGMLIKGTLKVVHDDGTEIVVSAGEAYSFAPGHDAWVVGNEEVISYEFNNSGKEYAVWKIN
tara:strand:- start:881 stop:1249 length:369 start_codon:yes stop_codon:yes gene_type:complete